MKISVIATTKPGYEADKEEFDNFSGHAAGVCYMAHDFDTILNENGDKTVRRVLQTKTGGHHSVYDHESISLYLDDVPKALAMVLNNEKQYTTSEKSARYTKMVLDEDTQNLYSKWMGVFEKEIADKYKSSYPDWFTDSRIKKLAQENARYLISVFTPTSLIYTTTYRQLNYVYRFLKNAIYNENKNKLYEMLTPAIKDFCESLKDTGYIDALFEDNKNRKLSLASDYVPQEYFGDVYSTSYKGSFAQLGQAQRHRTINYSMKLLDNEGKNDCKSVVKNFPQGMFVNISEMGTFDSFVLKMMERKCSAAQLEIDKQTQETLNKYVEALKTSGHPRAQELEAYTHGSRCTFPNFKCSTPCHFKDGITGERLI